MASRCEGMVMEAVDKALDLAKIWAAISSSGPIGLIIGVLLIGLVIWIKIKYKKMINEKARRETLEGRAEAEAKNPVENKADEDDMAKAEEEIEKILEEGDN